MAQAEFDRHVGAENFCENIQQALARARALNEAWALMGACVPVGTPPGATGPRPCPWGCGWSEGCAMARGGSGTPGRRQRRR